MERVTDDRALGAAIALQSYLPTHMDELEDLASHLGCHSSAIMRWLNDTHMPSGGENLLRLEGWLRAKGQLPALKLSRPMTVKQGLEKGLSERKLTLEEVILAVAVGNASTILSWLWTDRLPQTDVLWRLEWVLHTKGVRPMAQLLTMSDAAAAMLLAVGSKALSSNEVAEIVYDQIPNKHRLATVRSWLSGEESPSDSRVQSIIGHPKFARWIKALPTYRKEVERMQRQLLEKGEPTPEEVAVSNMTPQAPELNDTAVEMPAQQAQSPVVSQTVQPSADGSGMTVVVHVMIPQGMVAMPTQADDATLVGKILEHGHILKGLIDELLRGKRVDEAEQSVSLLREVERDRQMLFLLGNQLAAFTTPRTLETWLKENPVYR